MPANTYTVLIKEDGSVIRKPLHNDVDKQLDDLQSYVGGYIEFVRMQPVLPEIPTMMVVNDEGRLNGMEMNLIASVLAGQPISGPAVLVHQADPAGNTPAFKADDAHQLLFAVAALNEPPF